MQAKQQFSIGFKNELNEFSIGAVLGCPGLLWAAGLWGCSGLLWAALGCPGLLLAALGCSGLLWGCSGVRAQFPVSGGPQILTGQMFETLSS